MKIPICTCKRLARGVTGLLMAVCALTVAFTASANAQTLVISNGVHLLPGLTNTTVILTGRCELRIIGTNNPVSGCTIHLNSSDAWLLLLNVKPSVAVSTVIPQVRINGAGAVADSNCRVVQYGVGTVVIPQSVSFQPLRVFSGPHFTGDGLSLSRYVYYRGTNLGALNAAISSFELKRGYMATFAQFENGTGLSKCYVAADGDLEVGVLPGAFNDNFRFVYVVPWRWTSKKGIAGDPGINLLNVQWWYNWNINQNSTRDIEYVPIKQNRWWPSLSQDWQARGSVHLLGFNEPDKSDQANMTVAEAIAAWPELLATGLRVGSPATTDGGRSSWLYPFIDQADAAGLRVDFVAVHYYWCYNPADPDGAANQFYNFLKAVYDRTKRPVWVTEWNNGANWTTCGDPTFEQQRAAIAKMIEMLDNTPFVERYALYNWVEDCRALVTNSVLTPAGEVYRDKISPIGYVQELPDTGTRAVAQLGLDGDTLDSSGFGNNGMAVGAPGFAHGQKGLAIEFDGTNSYVQLPPSVARSNAFSFAAWVYWHGGSNWQRIFDFGNDTQQYMYLTPRSAGGTLEFGITTNGPAGKQYVGAAALPTGTWCHVAVTLSGNIARIYTNGQLAASATGITRNPAQFKPTKNYIAKSQWRADPLFMGLIDDVLITDYALTQAQIAALLTNSAPTVTTNYFDGGSALQGQFYTNSVAGMGFDPDPGDTLVYSKATGPAWLNVAPDGTLTGTPGMIDQGTNHFTVRITDSAGQSAYVVVAIGLPVLYGDGTWISNSDGLWSDPSRWRNGFVANGPGFTADFSTINITANRTVNLDSSRSIGTMRFGDTTGTQNWTITTTNDALLTLDSASATSQPSLVVTNTATVCVSLAGTNGFAKSGPGTLVLAAPNSLSGTITIDTASTTANEGSVRVAHPLGAINIGTILIRNNNNGSSTFELDGSAGGITVPGRLTINCRNVDVPAIRSFSGTNTLTGFIGLEVGGNRVIYQCDSGLLVFAGTNQYIGSLTGGRSYIFTGAGDHLVTGPIRNSTNGAPINLVKMGTGTLTLAATNNYGGTTAVSNGTLYVNGLISTGAVTVASGAVLGGTGTINGPVTVVTGGTIAPGVGIGKLTVYNSLTLQPGSVTRFELDKAANTNDFLRVTGTLTLAGTLVVTNIAGTLCPGDAFTLFSANNINSSFNTLVLPPLNFGLAWDTSKLGNANGVLSVVATNPPNVLNAQIQPDGLFGLSGLGSASQRYQLLATTNLTLPIVWEPVTNAVADTNGLFELIDPETPNFMQRFYRIQAVP